MKSSEHEKLIVFANCSGGARRGHPRPDLLGQEIGRQSKRADDNLIAVAVSEAMLTYPPDRRPQITKIGAMGEPVQVKRFERNGLCGCFLHDHDEVWTGLGGEWYEYYLSHLNSEDHRSPCAINSKWIGPEAVPRLHEQFEKHTIPLVAAQGLGLLLKQPPVEPSGVVGVLLRPSGLCPAENHQNDPMQFLGNRDTEPRVMAVVRTLIFGEEVHLAFCQLETHSTDDRLWNAGLQRPVSSLHRESQINAMLEYFNRTKVRRVILTGDFNARPAWPELTVLADAGFRQVMPESWPKKPPTWGVGLAYGAPFAPPAYEVSERTLGRPYTHCRHGVLIDHAFIKGFDESWSFSLAVLKSPEMEARCVTDHCPIALTVSKRS